MCYRTAEEAKTALSDINMNQGWIAELYRSTSKEKRNRVNKGYREEKNKAVEKSQQKGEENANTNEDNVTYSTKEVIKNLKKDLKYIRETLNAITSQQWLANKEKANGNIKGNKKQEKKELKDTKNPQSNKHKETEMKKKDTYQLQEMKIDINENRENTKKQDKSKNKTK